MNQPHVMWTHRARRYHRRRGSNPACGQPAPWNVRWSEATEHDLLDCHPTMRRCRRCWKDQR